MKKLALDLASTLSVSFWVSEFFLYFTERERERGRVGFVKLNLVVTVTDSKQTWQWQWEKHTHRHSRGCERGNSSSSQRSPFVLLLGPICWRFENNFELKARHYFPYQKSRCGPLKCNAWWQSVENLVVATGKAFLTNCFVGTIAFVFCFFFF